MSITDLENYAGLDKRLDANPSNEIRRLREQVAELTSLLATEKRIFNLTDRELQIKETENAALAASVAALAEQNEKMRKAVAGADGLIAQLRNHPCCHGCMISAAELLDELKSLSLPDLATPAINRIRAEGMRMAAEICESVEVPIDIEVWLGTKKALTSATAIGLATTIRARADELYQEVKP